MVASLSAQRVHVQVKQSVLQWAVAKDVRPQPPLHQEQGRSAAGRHCPGALC
jgi:hypothetical protein